MRTILLFSFGLIFLSPSIASAFEYKTHSWELGAEISHITYKEPDMKEKGLMYGIAGSYSYHKKHMVKLEGKFSYGQIDYSSPDLELKNINDLMLELRVLAGYDFPVGKNVILTPYIGFGYRYLNDAFSYRRESNYLYSPIGVTATANVRNGWTMDATAEFDLLWRGEQKSHLGDVTPGYPTVRNDQHDGYGFRGAITLQKILDTVTINMGPFIKYWHIDRSDNEYFSYGGRTFLVYEPNNTSTEIGCSLLLIF